MKNKKINNISVWTILAEKSFKKMWDNKKDNIIWKKYLQV